MLKQIIPKEPIEFVDMKLPGMKESYIMRLEGYEPNIFMNSRIFESRHIEIDGAKILIVSTNDEPYECCCMLIVCGDETCDECFWDDINPLDIHGAGADKHQFTIRIKDKVTYDEPHKLEFVINLNDDLDLALCIRTEFTWGYEPWRLHLSILGMRQFYE